MKRIAAPMVGGVVTSGIMELMVYPVIYFLIPRMLLQSRYLGFFLTYFILLFIMGILMKLSGRQELYQTLINKLFISGGNLY